MRDKAVDSEFHVDNRRRLAAMLKDRSVAIVHANDAMPTNADGTMGFRQNNDLLHLCGIDQEESILVLFPQAFNEKHRELLFLRENNEHIATWDGARLTKEQATEISGIQHVHWLQDFEGFFHMLMTEAERVYLNANEHPRRKPGFQARENRFTAWCREQYPLHAYERLAPLMWQLRVVKTPAEVAAIRASCALTGRGLRRVLRFIRPGVTEYQIEAEFAHEFLRRRGKMAYPPIIGTGLNACVLHYVQNASTCRAGELVLMDVGAQVGHYASDLTRTVPVSGRFTRRQRQVYEAVLRVMRHAMTHLRPGVLFRDYEKEVGKALEEECLRLGLLKASAVKKQDPEKPLYRKYMMHGTSHHIGLDVHDVTPIGRPLEAGAVVTVEPGLYLREEKLGVRLEDTICIRDGGVDDLMADIPIEADDLEDLMRRGRRR